MTRLDITAEELRAAAAEDEADAALVNRIVTRVSITRQLDRLNPPGQPTVALSLRQQRRDEPVDSARIGDDRESMLCDAEQVLKRLEALPNGAPLGTADPVPGSVWHALNASETEPTPSAEDYGEPYHRHGDGW